MKKSKLNKAEQKFIDEIKMDAGAYLELFNDISIQKNIRNGQMRLVNTTIDGIVEEAEVFIKEEGLEKDILTLSDRSLINNSCDIVEIVSKVNSLSPPDLDLTKLNLGTMSFFSKFDRLIGGNKELKDKLDLLSEFINMEKSNSLDIENINTEDLGKKELSKFIENIKILNREVRFLIQEIDQLKAERKSSPSLSQHFMASIKRELK